MSKRIEILKEDSGEDSILKFYLDGELLVMGKVKDYNETEIKVTITLEDEDE